MISLASGTMKAIENKSNNKKYMTDLLKTLSYYLKSTQNKLSLTATLIS